MRIIFILLFDAVIILPVAFSNTTDCSSVDELLQKSCKEVKYNDLPADVQNLMKIGKCRVGKESNYNYGSAINLTDSGNKSTSFAVRRLLMVLVVPKSMEQLMENGMC